MSYDNTPHFPDLSSFPHHKHLPNQVIASEQLFLYLVYRKVNRLTQ
ncbi:MAG: toxin-antitoxin system TumE family protein [Pseudanabaena sp.]